MSLAAVQTTSCYETCDCCDGEGTITFYIDRDSSERETEPCPEGCENGQVYIGPSAEPEDYNHEE